MSLFSLVQLDIWNEVAFRLSSRQMDEFLRGDFSSIETELQKAFPKSHKNLHPRYIPLVEKYADELSGMYSESVVRRFLPQGANGLPKEVWQKLTDVYDASRVDEALERAERFIWTHNTVAIIPLPVSVRKVLPLVISPWRMTVSAQADCMTPEDPDCWDKVEVVIPHRAGGATDAALIPGTLTLTPTEAWFESTQGSRRGIYREDGVNPLGRIPIVLLRRKDPSPGRIFAPVNEALLNLHVALCIQESDTELLVHTQAWGQKYIKNANVSQFAEQVQVGPETLLGLVHNGDPAAPSPELAIVQSNPPIAQIVTWQESRIRLLCSMLGLSADAFLRVNTALTASARLFADQDRRALRNRVRPLFKRAENELAVLIAQTLNLQGAVAIPTEELAVDVSYQDKSPSADPLHDMQAFGMQLAYGLTAPSKYVAERDRIGATEALKAVKANRQECMDLGIQPPPAAGGPAPSPASSTAAAEPADTAASESADAAAGAANTDQSQDEPGVA